MEKPEGLHLQEWAEQAVGQASPRGVEELWHLQEFLVEDSQAPVPFQCQAGGNSECFRRQTTEWTVEGLLWHRAAGNPEAHRPREREVVAEASMGTCQATRVWRELQYQEVHWERNQDFRDSFRNRAVEKPASHRR